MDPLAVGLLLLSVTSLTWSQAAGARIDSLRGALGLVTLSVSLTLDAETHPVAHAHHHAMPDVAAREDRVSELDAVAATARAAGLGSPFLEIRLPKAGQAWCVREHDRRWPT